MKWLLNKIKRKWINIRLQPIRVFCLHHISKKFDSVSMNEGDWIQINEFKSKVMELQQDGVCFISLTDAYRRICNDWFRCKRYAVLTFDDGYSSLKEILPWLIDKKIPVSLFINGKYLDGKSYRVSSFENYLTRDDLFNLQSSYVEIGNHGWEHMDSCQMSLSDFEYSVLKNVEMLSHHSRYISFWAYTWGSYNDNTDKILKRYNLTPVLMDGQKNYNNICIHREFITNLR